MSFANQVAVVTGASSGIGYAVAKELAAGGCHVGLLARRIDKLHALADEIRKSDGKVAAVQADVGDRTQTHTAIASLREQLGPIDLLFANAGVGTPTTVEPFNIEAIEQMLRVNTLGVAYSIDAVLPEMLSRKKGHLAAVSSLAAYKGFPGQSGYCASKSAVNAFMEGLRIQLRTCGITVTTICPGFIRTPMIEQNRGHMPFVMDADKAARKIVGALQRKKKVYNFPWQTTMLVKLTRWLPDWYVRSQLDPDQSSQQSQQQGS